MCKFFSEGAFLPPPPLRISNIKEQLDEPEATSTPKSKRARPSTSRDIDSSEPMSSMSKQSGNSTEDSKFKLNIIY